MKYLLRFPITTTFLFVASYLVGGSYVIKIILRNSSNSENDVSNGLVAVACLVVSLYFYYNIITSVENPPLHQKVSIYLYTVTSFVLPGLYLFLLRKEPVSANNLVDITLLTLVTLHSSVVGGFLIEFIINDKKYISQNFESRIH
jgi:O-antigen ligase